MGSALLAGCNLFPSIRRKIKRSISSWIHSSFWTSGKFVNRIGLNAQNFLPSSKLFALSPPTAKTSSKDEFLGSWAPMEIHLSKSAKIESDNLPDGGICKSCLSYLNAFIRILLPGSPGIMTEPFFPPLSQPALRSRSNPAFNDFDLAEWHS